MKKTRKVLIAVHEKNKKIIKTEYGSFTQLGLTQQNILHLGTIIHAYVYEGKDTYAYYVELKNITNCKRNVVKQAGATLCSNYRHFFSHTAEDVYDVIANATDYVKSFTYKYNTKNKVQEKISQFHHNHVRMKDLYGDHEYVKVQGGEAMLLAYLDSFTNKAVTHVTFITYYRCLDKEMQRLFLNMIRLNKGITVSMLKTEGTKSKQLQHLSKRNLAKIFELAVLVNRVDTEVDWEQEKKNRTQIQAVQIDYDDVYKLAIQLFSMARAEHKTPIKMEWEDYWLQRAALTPQGAVHSQFAEDQKIINEIPRLNRTKKTVVASMPTYEHTHFYKQKRELHAYTSTKYEWGKVRALYGCDLTSHINADFGLLQCEDTFPSFIPTGSYATPDYVKSITDSMTQTIPFCYDYDDFNSQHSKSSMQAVIDAWLSVYSHDLTPEQVKSVMWTSDSVNKMYVHNMLKDEHYECQGTLFSGWRLTTFINTALNWVYLKHAGLGDLTEYSIHNGDDVFAGVNDLQSAVDLVAAGEKIGVRANTTKMSIGTIAEFLRMDMQSNEFTTAQYLTRGVATFVHSRIESESPNSCRGLVSAYATRYRELLERGAVKSYIKKAFRTQLRFAAKLFDTKLSDIKLYLKTDITSGGFLKDGVVDDYIIKDEAYEVNTTKWDVQGVKDYATYLNRKFPLLTTQISLSNVVSSFSTMFNKQKTKIVVEAASRADATQRKALKGAWSQTRGVTIINKLRIGVSDVIIAIQAIKPEQAAVLQQSGDAWSWMRILY